MTKKIKIILSVVFLLMFASLNSWAINNSVLKIGDKDAKVTVKVFSSLTCPHCATFHNEVFKNLNNEYIVNNKINFEHHAFPLDLAALTAEKILRCTNWTKKSFQLLNEIYLKQDQWAVGSDINVINKSIKKMGKKYGLDEKKMNLCLDDEKTQDQILNERIEAQKKYKISSTPTIYINEKKYDGKHDYKKFKKELDKFLK